MIRVVSAAIVRNRRLLLTQRAKKGRQPLTWETPGGKVETGESDEEALLREIAEELLGDGFKPGYPKVGRVVAELIIGPPDLPELIHLIIYQVTLGPDDDLKPMPIVADGLGWFRAEEVRVLLPVPSLRIARKELIALLLE